MSHSDAWEYNRTCDVCWRRLTTLDDMCETCEDNISLKIQEDNRENNMNNNNELEIKIKELEARLAIREEEVTQLAKAREDYRKLYNTSVEDTKYNVKRIEEVLHSHAKDCDDQTVIDILIEQINEATRNGFPELRKCSRTYELTITYKVDVQAASEDDAIDNFDEGDYNHLIELSDYYELDADEGY
jgi:hypothetical protein